MDTALLHSSFSTRDTGVAEAHLLKSNRRSALRTPDTGVFSFAQHIDGVPSLTATRVEVRGAVDARIEVQSAFVVGHAVSGRHQWRSGDHDGLAPRPFLFQPGQSIHAEFSDVRVETLAFAPTALEERARLLYGNPALRLRFDDPAAISPEHERFVGRALAVAASALTDPALEEAPLLIEIVQRQVAVAVLEAFRLDGRAEARGASAVAQQNLFRGAVGYFRDHLDQPVTSDDAARHLGVSTIDLVRAMRRHANCTPSEFLRRERLGAAHDDLVDAEPGTTTVGAIARRWGFRDLGAFERRYRAAFRRAPIETLAR